MYLYLRVCSFGLFFFFLKQTNKQTDSIVLALFPSREKRVGVGEQCRTLKALTGHLGQPSMCSGCPCYLVSNRWSSVHHSLPGCWVSGWKLQKHPASRVCGSRSHWSVTGWSVQTLIAL